MFSIFKRKGLTYKQRRENDFATAKGAIKKGDKLSDRDKKMIAVGRTHVHVQNYEAYKYNDQKQKAGKAKTTSSKPASKPANKTTAKTTKKR